MSGSDRRAGRRSDFLPFSIQIPKERPEIDVDDVLEFCSPILKFSSLNPAPAPGLARLGLFRRKAGD